MKSEHEKKCQALNDAIFQEMNKLYKMSGKILTYIKIRVLLEFSQLGKEGEEFENIKRSIEWEPTILQLKDKAGNTLLFYAKNKVLKMMLSYKEALPDHRNNDGQTYKEFSVSKLVPGVVLEKTEEVIPPKIKISSEKIAEFAPLKSDPEISPEQRAQLFSLGFIIGKAIVKPGIDYLDDNITGDNPGKSIYSYYLDQFSLKNVVQGVIYSATQLGLFFVPMSSNAHKSYVAKTVMMANTALFAKLTSDAIYGDIEFSIKYAEQSASHMLGAVVSGYGQIYLSGTSLYANHPFDMGFFASIVPDVIKLAYHSAQLEDEKQGNCRKYNEYQERALYEGVDKSQSCLFDNQYQIVAIKYFKVSALKAVKFHSQIQISALRATGLVSEALKFENKYQIDAYKLIKNVEVSLQIDDLYKFRALKLGASPEDAVKFSDECQLQALIEGTFPDIALESECLGDSNNYNEA